jgi:uroporphyrin-3 C-methyltransferase
MDMQENTTQQLPPSPPVEKATKNTASLKKIASRIGWLIILAAIGMALYMWQHHVRTYQKNIDKNIYDIQQTLSQLKNKTEETSQKIAATQSALAEQKAFEQQNTTLLLEVNYLVQLASFHLLFDHNIPLARQLLEAADARIATPASPALWPVRKALAEDIAALKAAPDIDLPGVVARIGGLIQQAESLPKAPIATRISNPSHEDQKTYPPKPDPSPQNQPTPLSSTFHSFLGALKKIGEVAGSGLSQMVILSKNHADTPILLTAEQYVYIITNIQSQLTLAEWAVIHRQEKIYQQSLSQIDTWLQHYFSTDNTVVQSMLSTLKTLQNISVNPATPNLLHSIDTLKTL